MVFVQHIFSQIYFSKNKILRTGKLFTHKHIVFILASFAIDVYIK